MLNNLSTALKPFTGLKQPFYGLLVISLASLPAGLSSQSGQTAPAEKPAAATGNTAGTPAGDGKPAAPTQPAKPSKPSKKEQNWLPSSLLMPELNSISREEAQQTVDDNEKEQHLEISYQALRLGRLLKDMPPGRNNGPLNTILTYEKEKGRFRYEQRWLLYSRPDNSGYVTGNKTLVLEAGITGEKINALKIQMTEERLRPSRSLKVVAVNDPSPGDADYADIQIYYRQDIKVSEKKLTDLTNTFTRPERNRFRRRFYLPRLRDIISEINRTVTILDHRRYKNRSDFIDNLD